MEETRQEEWEEAVKRAQALAEKAHRANEAKSEYLASISHEMRTPLNGILGLAEILMQGGLTDEQRQRVSIIQHCGQNLLNLVNDILDSSKIEAGMLTIHQGDCNLAQVLNATESMLSFEAQKKNIALEIVEGAGLPARIHTDQLRLQQCLVNLTGNAIKFTSEGYVRVSLSRVEDAGGSPAIRFDVADTGIGIPPDQQEAIFDPFTQAEANTTRRYGGTGLGLTITRQLVELMQGELTLSSEVGRGSVFSMVIPAGLDMSQQPPLDRQNQSLVSEPSAAASETVRFSGDVLVAEDVETNQIVIQSMLEQFGVDVTMVSDGDLAIAEVRRKAFDLVLMDVSMPGRNGLEATTLLRAEGVRVPIIALTGFASYEDEQRCLEAGCSGHLCKPIERGLMYEIVSRYLPARPDGDLAHVPSIEDRIPEPLTPTTQDAHGDCEQSGDEQIINWKSLIERLRDEELIQELLPTYLQDNEEHFKQLNEALEAEDLNAVASHAHAICGAGRNLGAARLSTVAKNMETSARQGNLEEAKATLPKFKAEIERLFAFMSRPDWMDIAKSESQ